MALTVGPFVLRAKSSDQRERVIHPVRQHRFGWRSYRPVKLPVAIAVALTILLWCCVARGVEAQPPVPTDVRTTLEKLQSNPSGNWWTARVGSDSGAFTVNWGANKHCLLVDGRRFVDAVSFTGVIGWYPRAQQLVGTFYFDDGDSVLVRATINSESDGGQIALHGTVSGTLYRKPVDSPFAAKLAADQWTFELKSADGTPVIGHFSGPRPTAQPASATPAQQASATP